jgi:hypothetical protein
MLHRHLGAILVAAAILLVGGGGIATRAAINSSANAAPANAWSSSASGTSNGFVGSSSADQRFVSVVQDGGLPITTSNQQDFITVGHNVCGMLAQGYSVVPMISYLTTQKGYSSSQAATFVGASIGAYCPQYRPAAGTN